MPSALLIGSGTLLISCGNVLLDQGVAIKLVVASTEDAAHWAASKRLPVLHSLRSVPQDFEPVDYLFSIVNDWILPDSILRKAKIAINYHDSLLPRYAGVNSTTWAIINGETQHGVSWHKMEVGIDTGAILEQQVVSIDNLQDTALSLNLKCYLAAISTFQKLAERISRGDALHGTQQDPSARSYFGVSHQLPLGGFVDCSRDVQEAARICRALHFGPTYSNPVGTQKVLLADRVFLVSSLEAVSAQHSFHHGLVVASDSAQGVQIAAQGGYLRLTSVTTLAGLAISDLSTLFKPGMTLGVPTEQLLSTFGEAHVELLKKEKLWATTLAATPALLSVMPPSVVDGRGASSLSEGMSICVDHTKLPKWALSLGASSSEAVLALLCAFLGSINNFEKFHLRIGTKEVRLFPATSTKSSAAH